MNRAWWSVARSDNTKIDRATIVTTEHPGSDKKRTYYPSKAHLPVKITGESENSPFDD